MKFTSGEMLTPNLSYTDFCIFCERAMISFPVAPPALTNTKACLSCTPAFPNRLPFQPHWSIIQAAGIFTRPASTS